MFSEKSRGLTCLTGHSVEKIDVKKKTVTGTSNGEKNFEYPYDKLLIATGARAAKPRLPGFDLPGVMVLKNLEEGRQNQAIH